MPGWIPTPRATLRLALLMIVGLAASAPLGAQANRGRVHSTHSVGSTTDLNFGTLIAGTTGGTLTLDTSNTRTGTGSVVPMPAAPTSVVGQIVIDLNGNKLIPYTGGGGNWIADYYIFIGTDKCATPLAGARDPGFAGYPVRTPNPYTIPNLTLTSGTNSMVVNFTPQSTANPPGYYTTTPYIGTATNPVVNPPQYIVGTLNVGANQAPGTYTGSFNLAYNDGNGANYTTITVSAKVLGALTLTKNADMQFGTLLENGAGTVVLSPAGALTPSSQITAMGGTVQAAQFAAKGTTGSSYLFSLPGSVTLSDGAGHSVIVDTFTTNPAASGTFPAVASQPVLFNVGGTLHLTGTEVDGQYNASLASGGSTFIANIVYN
ncbi:MAG: DUF4402 domain-containing protein [Acidobacteria bacterium]|nr:DUF4402 domain-containing protein [Acidobacteriota bacterium]